MMKMYSFVLNMSLKLLTISQAAEILGVSIQILRRWDYSGKLPSASRKAAGYRHYLKSDIENYIKNNQKDLFLFKMARNWLADDSGFEPLSDFYCPDVSVFQARLTRLENELGKIERINKIFPLISAITGEIGNNSFDHNLGNWPDVPGIFFAYDLNKKIVVLADRGQGILKTLKRVIPNLKNHREALYVAFTKIISGRRPESRGNGLKFVKEVVMNNKISLFFQTGNAYLKIKNKEPDLKAQKAVVNFRGCLALIKF